MMVTRGGESKRKDLQAPVKPQHPQTEVLFHASSQFSEDLAGKAVDLVTTTSDRALVSRKDVTHSSVSHLLHHRAFLASLRQVRLRTNEQNGVMWAS